MEEGMSSFQRGDFEQAIASWTEAAQLYEKKGTPKQRIEVLTNLSQAYQSIGQHWKAIENLELALVLAEGSADRASAAFVLSNLGSVYIATGPTDKARQHLNEALANARELKDFGLSALILNNLGNLLVSENQYQEAVDAYVEASTIAEKVENAILSLIALSNAATASIRDGQHKKSKKLLDKALDRSKGTADSHDKAYALINIGLGYRELGSHMPRSKDSLVLLAFKAFSEATIVSESINDMRAVSYAWGYLGSLYEDEGRYKEALETTRRANFAAQQVNAPESLYRWQWQTGRLLRQQGKTDEAISAYRHAVDNLHTIRPEISVTYGSKESSFRESLGSMYFELVDLLLQRAATMQDREQQERFLIEAREKVELFKIAELQDYFQDDCVGVGQQGMATLDVVSQSAVVIYPIPLPDRIELLVSFPGGLKRFSVPVGIDALTQEIRDLRRKLEKRTSREYLPHAKQLYTWLIKPLEQDLASLSIDTLVFVPDGALRTIPMAALNDGKEFLVNKFALAITPGLNLTSPGPIRREGIKILSVGLTESSQGFPPLPHVSEELQTIQELYGGRLLLNENFLVSSMEKALQEEAFNIIHVASHGVFDSNVDGTFLLTFDDKLTLDRLDHCVGFLRFREDPLALLTLSACETAAGDDRAALGLAGVAVKAGASSALATLWYVNDRASSLLVSEFYRQLREPKVSRAVALQRAQLKLLSDLRYDHPGYWAPFLLINDWL
jgi:CHAT domain-containing protein/Tfp pilus assembly protein PilF